MPRQNIRKTVCRLAAQFLFSAAFLGAALCLAAGTPHYWQAWAMTASLLLPMMLTTVYFAVRMPDLIRRRQFAGRKLSSFQKAYMTFIYFAEFALLLVPALGLRFGWPHMPDALCLAGDGMLAAANLVWFVSKRENPYAGNGITIYEGHRLITTGPYALVRHPNYAGDLLMCVGLALALGCWRSLAVFVLIIPAIVIMIFDEERFLSENLPGYTQYTGKVRYRLLPGIW